MIRFLLGTAFISVLVSSPALGSPFLIGVPRPTGDAVRVLDRTTPLSILVGGALLGRLIDVDDTGEIRLLLAREVQRIGGSSGWRFALREDARFHGGAPITSDDVLYSLSRCRDEGLFPRGTEFQILDQDTLQSGGLRLMIATPAALVPLSSIARCPILEASSSRIFGTGLGSDTLFRSAGPFVWHEFVPGRRAVFIEHSRPEGTARSIEVRFFDNDPQALSMIRAGGLALAAVSDEGTLARARSDETLRVVNCSGYNLVARRSVTFRCGAWLLAETLRDESVAARNVQG